MRVFYFVFLALFVTVGGVYAQDDKAKTDPHITEPATFKEAYTSYQQAVNEKENRKRPSKRGEVTNFNHRITYYVQKAYELGIERYGTEHINSVNLAINWAEAYSTHSVGHDYPDKRLSRDIKGLEKAIAANPPELIDFYMAYSSFLIQQPSSRAKNRSVRYFDKAIKVARDLEPENEIIVALTSLQVGKILYSNYNIAKTSRLLQNAQKILSKYPEEHKNNLAMTNFWLAKSYISTKKYATSTKYMTTALKTLDAVAPTSHYTLSAHAFMVQILEKQGLRDEATEHCQIIGRTQPKDDDREYLPLYRLGPQYPRKAAERGIEGWVTVEFDVDEQGFIQKPFVLERAPKDKVFDTASLKAVLGFRYAPKFENGKAVYTEGVRTRFTYKLNKR